MMIIALKQIPETGSLDFVQECYEFTVCITCLNLTQTKLKRGFSFLDKCYVVSSLRIKAVYGRIASKR